MLPKTLFRDAALLGAGLSLFIVLLFCRQGNTAGDKPEITAQKALAVSIEKFMKWKSYRYRGTSSLTISGRPELANSAAFDTRLQVNEEGAVDGHMVVESASPGGSYEAYSHKRITYRKLKGGEWSRNSRSAQVRGSGMVSFTARRIIAAFADLVEDVSYVRVTDDDLVITCTMGTKYDAGARRIAGGGGHSHEQGGAGTGSPPAKGTVMHITIDRKTMEMKRVWMKAGQDTGTEAGTVTTITEGTYTEINKPQNVKPVAEALNAPEGTE